ncbi:MAG TPA: HIT family protein [Salinivirgaceae bacterium]|nr:HIT family protein [Salinivirgaceae bacterium]
MATIFSRIVSGEIPSYKIAETERCFAFLDINPLKEGHTLVIPKREVDDFFDLSDEELKELMIFSKRIATAIKKSFECKKVSVSVIGLEVPHAHLHLIPINSMDDCNFMRPKIKVEEGRMIQIQETIQKNLTF